MTAGERRSWPSAAFLDPIPKSTPITIPASRGEAVCSSSSGSTIWGSIPSAQVGTPLPGSSSVRGHHILSMRFGGRTQTRDAVSLTELEEATSSLTLGGYSPASIPILAEPGRPYVVDEDDDDDEEENHQSLLTRYTVSPLSSMESFTPSKKLESSKPPMHTRPEALPLYQGGDSTFHEIDQRLGYLNKAGKLRAKKTLSLIFDSCSNSKEVELCKNICIILSELEIDQKTLQAGALSAMKSPDSHLVSSLESDIVRLTESRNYLHTKLMRTQESGESAQAQLKEILDNLSDFRVVAIELAHALIVLRSAKKNPYTDKQFINSFTELTLSFYAPLAHSCGFSGIQRELEETAFELKHPEEFRKLKMTAQQNTDHFAEVLESCKEEVKRVLWSDHVLRSKVSCLRVSGRQKSLYSIYKKMQKKDLDVSQVLDMLAIRVILSPRPGCKNVEKTELESCYRAMEIVHRTWALYNNHRMKDYIASPKSNGYRSLHTTVSAVADGEQIPLEIQVRSDSMHRIAEMGSAAHVQYKGDGLVHHHPHIGNMRYCMGHSLAF